MTPQEYYQACAFVLNMISAIVLVVAFIRGNKYFERKQRRAQYQDNAKTDMYESIAELARTMSRELNKYLYETEVEKTDTNKND